MHTRLCVALIAVAGLGLLLAAPIRAQEEAGAVARIAQVNEFTGEVQLKSAASGELRMVTQVGSKIRNSSVFAGDEIVTGPTGKVHLLLEDGSILDLTEPGTRVVITQGPLGNKVVVGKAAGKTTLRTIKVLAGKIHSEVQHDTGVYTEFETPSGVAGVKGTVLDLTVTGNSLNLQLGPNSNIVFSNDAVHTTVDIGEGQQVQFDFDPATHALSVHVLNDNGHPVEMRLGNTLVSMKQGDGVGVKPGQNGATVTGQGGAPTVSKGDGGGPKVLGEGQSESAGDGAGGGTNGGGTGGTGGGDTGGTNGGSSGGGDTGGTGGGDTLVQNGGSNTTNNLPHINPTDILYAPFPVATEQPNGGADYLLLTLNGMHGFFHAVNDDLDPTVHPNTDDLHQNFVGPNPENDSVWQLIQQVNANHAAFDLQSYMSVWASQKGSEVINKVNEQYDRYFGGYGGYSGYETANYPEPEGFFSRANALAVYQNYFQRLSSGDFHSPQAAVDLVHLWLQEGHLDWHNADYQGGVHLAIDHEILHHGIPDFPAPTAVAGLVDRLAVMPPSYSGPLALWGGLDGLTDSLHANMESNEQLEAWFHAYIGPFADEHPLDLDLDEIHRLWHRMNGLPLNDLHNVGTPNGGADYLLLALNSMHAMWHFVNSDIDNAVGAYDDLHNNEHMPRYYPDEPSITQLIELVSSRHDRFDLNPVMRTWVYQTAPRVIANDAADYDTWFGTPDTDPLHAGFFSRSNLVASDARIFERLRTGDFGTVAAAQDWFDLILQQAHMDWHRAVDHGGVHLDVDHAMLHNGPLGGFTSECGCDVPVFAGLEGLHQAFHDNSGSQVQLEAFFHSTLCGLMGRDGQAQCIEIHRLWHQVLGLPGGDMPCCPAPAAAMSMQ